MTKSKDIPPISDSLKTLAQTMIPGEGEKDLPANDFPSTSALLKNLNVSAKIMAPDEVEKELSAFENQRPILSEALRKALLRKMGILKHDFSKEAKSLELTIDFLSDLVVDLEFGKKIRKIILIGEIEHLIKGAMLEIHQIWNYLKKHEKVKNGSRYIEKRYRNIVLKYFDSYNERFKYIRRQYLEDWNVYSLRETQAFGDFSSKLLQKIVADYGLADFSPKFVNELRIKIEKNK